MALCPRCDYDLSGEIDAWKERCPLHGRCPECGLELHWSRVFRAEPPPGWSVEHVPASSWRVPLAAVRSAFLALAPWRLWRGLNLSMPVAPRRLAVMLVLWAGLSYVAAAAVMVGMLCLEAYSDYRYQVLSAAWAAATPGVSPRLSPTPWGEACTYALVYEWYRWLSPYFNVERYLPGAPAFRGIEATPVLLVAMLVLAMPATLAVMPYSLRRAKVRGRHLVRLTAYWLVWMPVLCMAPAVGDSLHRQADQWSYNLSMRAGRAGPPLPAWRLSLADGLEWYTRHDSALAACLLLGLVLVFWGWTARRYLRLPHAWAVALALTLMSGLFTACAGYFMLEAGPDLLQLFDQFMAR